MNSPSAESHNDPILFAELQRPLYFLHIHKTGGTSFMQFIKHCVSVDLVCPAYQWYQLLDIPHDTLKKYRVFCGHFHDNLGSVLGVAPITITLIRHPVERVLSRISHLQRDKRHYLYALAKDASLPDFLGHPELRAQISNLQTLHIAHHFDPLELSRRYGIDPLQPLALERLINARFAEPGIIPPGLLGNALARLEEFPFIGITEYYAQSMKLFESVFGVASRQEAQKLNASPSRLEAGGLPAAVLEEIYALNELDMQLYEAGLKRFRDLCRRHNLKLPLNNQCL